MKKPPSKPTIGKLYYEPTGKRTGTIRIITFGDLPKEITKDYLMVEMDPEYLIQYTLKSVNIGDYRVLVNDDGTASIQKIERKQTSGKYELSFRKVLYRQDCDKCFSIQIGTTSNTVILFDPDNQIPIYGKLKLWAAEKNHIHIPIWDTIISMNDIIDNNAEIELPEGFPNQDYILLAESPHLDFPVFWKKSDD